MAVHQFHSGTAVGDAITNAMLLTRQVLRGLGYHSRIFAEHIDPALQDEIHGKDALPEHDRYVLILRHSMGHDALEQVLGLRAPKILMYHNITPPELLAGSPFMQRYARLGRQQLETIRPAVVAALADSEYNAMELRRLGFDRVAACTLLFDLGEQGAAVAARPERAMAASGLPALFTVLFVGRITASKGQLALVAGFARFRSGYAGATQLVLVGRQDDAAAITELLSLVRRLGLDQGAVDVAGLVSDAVLERRYAEADLYVSASQHEGFGVPLIEAVARGVPVLAVGAGAVPYTLGAPAADPAGLLADTTPTGIAAAILALAMDPAGRASLAESQRASMQRFTLERQIPALVDAVVEAGAARPVDGATRAALAANARFTVAGHVNGTYSLAEINRSLALALEAARPGTVRLLAVEGGITTHVGHVPAEQRGCGGDAAGAAGTDNGAGDRDQPALPGLGAAGFPRAWGRAAGAVLLGGEPGAGGNGGGAECRLPGGAGTDPHGGAGAAGFRGERAGAGGGACAAAGGVPGHCGAAGGADGGGAVHVPACVVVLSAQGRRCAAGGLGAGVRGT